MSEQLNVLTISDIHVDDKNAEQLRKELFYGVLTDIRTKKHGDLDIVAVCGDLIHKRLYGDGSGMLLAVEFMANLVELAECFDFILIVFDGTRSHDMAMVATIMAAYRNHPNVRYFRTSSIINITRQDKEYRIAIVPEEYPQNRDEYYQFLFDDAKINGKFHYILGHGAFEFAMYVDKHEVELLCASAPIFPNDYFNEICGGYIIFGHIHNRTSKGLVEYNGSYSTGCFADTDDKGYLVSSVAYDFSNKSLFFIKNEFVRSYKTFKLSDVRATLNRQEKYVESSQLQQMAMLCNLVNKQFEKFNHIRIDIDERITPAERQIMGQFFDTNPYAQLNIKVDMITDTAEIMAHASDAVTPEGEEAKEANANSENHPIVQEILNNPNDIVDNILKFNNMIRPDGETSLIDPNLIKTYMQ